MGNLLASHLGDRSFEGKEICSSLQFRMQNRMHKRELAEIRTQQEYQRANGKTNISVLVHDARNGCIHGRDILNVAFTPSDRLLSVTKDGPPSSNEDNTVMKTRHIVQTVARCAN